MPKKPVKKTLTTEGIKALVARPPHKRVDHFDAATAGLCLTIGPKAATWYVFRRIDGKLTRITLGSWPELGLQGARGKVEDIATSIAAGKHPKAERAREQAAKAEARAIDHDRLVERVGKAWSRVHFPTLSKSTATDYQRGLDEFTTHFAGRELGTIKRGEVKRFLDTVQARSPSAANRAAVVIRLLFGYARDRYELADNPVVDLKNPAKQKARDRVLSRAEIRVLWHACEAAGYPYGHALRFALCTGQRIGEVGALRRSDVDSDGEFWIQTENKTKKRIDIFLAPLARAILKSCPKIGKVGWYFTNDGDVPLRKDIWHNSLRRHITPHVDDAAKALGLPTITAPWTPHDLRRTVRTGLTGWCQVAPDTAERVLNHAIGGLRAVYDHADYKPHVTGALQQWDAELARIIRGERAAVISIKSKQPNPARAGSKRPAA